MKNLLYFIHSWYLRLILQDVLSKKPELLNVFKEFADSELDETDIGNKIWDINNKDFIFELKF